MTLILGIYCHPTLSLELYLHQVRWTPQSLSWHSGEQYLASTLVTD